MFQRIAGYRRSASRQFLGDGRVALDRTDDQVTVRLEWSGAPGRRHNETVVVPRGDLVRWALSQVSPSEIAAAAGPEFHGAWRIYRNLVDSIK